MRIHQEGRSTVCGAVILFLSINLFLFFALESRVAFWIVLPISLILIGLTVHFFQNPDRPFEGVTNGSVVASADGSIVAVERVFESEVLNRECIQVSTFMTIFNIHANWIPAEGIVRRAEHVPGNFLAAYLPKSSIENEHSITLIETPEGHEVVVKQVAGAVARRIVNYAVVGETAHLGRQLGFIKFGSRVDLFLPLDSEVLVHLGDKVQGNITTIARLPQTRV